MRLNLIVLWNAVAGLFADWHLLAHQERHVLARYFDDPGTFVILLRMSHE